MIITKADINDEHFIKQIYKECNKELGSFNLFYVWDEYITQGKGNFDVIRPFAFVRWGYSKKYGAYVLNDIGVLKSARGSGYGEALLKFVPTPMVLKCNCDNQAGNEFYLRMGMIFGGTTKTKSGKPQNIWTCAAW